MSPSADDAPVEGPWLDATQQQAWRRLAAVVLKLPSELEAQLQRDSALSHFEYWVLALLSEADDHRLPLSALAAQANASLSRLSHVVTRLERRDLVERATSTADARVRLAVLTAAGLDLVGEAAPGHVAAVRSLVFDGLDDQGVADLTDVCEAILRQLELRQIGPR